MNMLSRKSSLKSSVCSCTPMCMCVCVYAYAYTPLVQVRGQVRCLPSSLAAGSLIVYCCICQIPWPMTFWILLSKASSIFK